MKTDILGKSAVEFINSGVEYLKKNSWVNGDKIGIQGKVGAAIKSLILSLKMICMPLLGLAHL